MPQTALLNDPRYPALAEFLTRTLPDAHTPPVLVSSDASGRRYWRTRLKTGETRIVMDAPPPGEDTLPFIDVLERLTRIGIPVPALYGRNTTEGFLLLEDLGDETLFRWRHGQTAEQVIGKLATAVDLLPELAGADTDGLPRFDAARLAREMDLLPDWYLRHYKQQVLSDELLTQWSAIRNRICDRLTAMPQVFVHRDYHSRNLMVQPDRLTVIDFQDAVRGPLAYDLVSLLRDSYIDWPEETVQTMQARFWAALPDTLRQTGNLVEFRKDFAWVAVQRHLKVLGIFARLSFRDGKHGYLNDLPLTWRHLQRALDGTPELADLAALLAPFAPTEV
ncbi:hypothetical protein A9404_10410 [Halothiobacillus diazotrophicus]|uniref:Aminoglycoside phosphotransferase domain-containing protein n=1 Tax=Halothiobacillus diazotrophicus TaxID=1860122 RepID=A0A191ZIN3_9GAMM|nr:phosphotransferase [Halothiobacillus diazotrophicus]ANJ67734.1 hypothetical protein A9404_10410 [Halothiobacillus diazotrophicus]